MPTGTNKDSLPDHASATQASLVAYAAGQATPEEQWLLEMQAAADPLLQDAIDGLREPGALQALSDLRRPDGIHSRTDAGMRSLPWIIGGALLLAVAGALWWSADQRALPTTVAEVATEMQPSHTTNEQAIAANSATDNATEAPTPALLSAATTPGDRGPGSAGAGDEASTADRTDAPDKIAPVLTDPMSTGIEANRPATHRRAHGSLQLTFLHDLKLVHPKELYGGQPTVRVSDLGVNAAFPDRTSQEHAAAQTRTVAYLEFMDEALSHFARAEHGRCLEELRFLLRQYPDDPNATFYAGLCHYELGAYQHAETLLHKAAAQPIAVFDEEAAWYQALAVRKQGRRAEAQGHFARIAKAGGFYADRARAAMAEQ